jgi:phosphoglycolate phosphatase-like HAD superfamily hydrolase
MKYKILIPTLLIIAFAGLFISFQQQSKNESHKTETAAKTDPLPSWNDGSTKKSIIDFVTKTTKKGGADFIPVSDRIACFDNDGTLWCEQPQYFQVYFMADRIKALAPLHPEWLQNQPFKAVLEGDLKTALAGGNQAFTEMLYATHAGTTTDEFEKIVKDWLDTAKHPVSHRPYTEMVFQPMLELLIYLRVNGYKTFIVSGGEIDFMRPWTESVYGIPPEQVVGTSLKEKYEVRDSVPVIVLLPELNFYDDKAGKPVGIQQYTGRRPVFAAGNSDGDYEMLQWTSTATGYPRFGMFVHHTDSIREWSYDRTSSIGHLERGLDDASKYNWLIVDMKNDWKVIYPFEKK